MDDTQMSLAVAELLLREEEPAGDAFADAFLATYRRDPRPGYSSHFAVLLEACASGAALRRRLPPGSRLCSVNQGENRASIMVRRNVRAGGCRA